MRWSGKAPGRAATPSSAPCSPQERYVSPSLYIYKFEAFSLFAAPSTSSSMSLTDYFQFDKLDTRWSGKEPSRATTPLSAPCSPQARFRSCLTLTSWGCGAKSLVVLPRRCRRRVPPKQGPPTPEPGKGLPKHTSLPRQTESNPFKGVCTAMLTCRPAQRVGFILFGWVDSCGKAIASEASGS